MGLGVTGAARHDLIVKDDVEFFVTTFLRAVASREVPKSLQIDGEPCLLVRGDQSAILLTFAEGEHLAQFVEAVGRTRAEQEKSRRVDRGMVHGPSGVMAIPVGAAIRSWWQALRPSMRDGQLPGSGRHAAQ